MIETVTATTTITPPAAAGVLPGDAVAAAGPTRSERRAARRAARRERNAHTPGWIRWLRRASWAFMGMAVLLVGYVGLLVGYQSYEQHRLSAVFDQRVPPSSVHDVAFTSATVATLHPHLADGEPVARLELPSLGWNAIVTEGSDTGILSSGPGHDDHTAYPGEGGMVLIGNHNGFSMSWGDLHEGDEIVVTMSYGRFHYKITRRYTVSGDDTSVVAQHFNGETLLMTTCWPLWQGAFAHDRLIFEATPVVQPT